jgi:hypothetical protein
MWLQWYSVGGIGAVHGRWCRQQLGYYSSFSVQWSLALSRQGSCAVLCTNFPIKITSEVIHTTGEGSPP